MLLLSSSLFFLLLLLYYYHYYTIIIIIIIIIVIIIINIWSRLRRKRKTISPLSFERIFFIACRWQWIEGAFPF